MKVRERVFMASFRSAIRITRIFGALVLVTGMFAVRVPSAGATPTQCRVLNLTTALVYRGKGPNLQRAIDEAAGGTTLRLQGLCVGNFTIGKDLSLIGITTTPAYGAPTLDGNAAGTVLSVSGGSVNLKNLTITNGSASGIFNTGALILRGSTSVTENTALPNGVGAGIDNRGTLILKDSSSVTGNNAGANGVGGGVYNFGGTLILKDSSSVSGNTALFAGGIENIGTVVLKGSSSVSGNTTVAAGGGIENFRGTVVLKDSSSVSGNTANSVGGGIRNEDGTLVLKDSSSVSGNTAAGGSGGGGIYNEAHVILKDSSSVSGNTAVFAGGGIWNGGRVLLEDSSSVTGNTASSSFGGGGIFHQVQSRLGACETWSGAISPNNPDDPPTPTPVAC